MRGWRLVHNWPGARHLVAAETESRDLAIAPGQGLAVVDRRGRIGAAFLLHGHRRRISVMVSACVLTRSCPIHEAVAELDRYAFDVLQVQRVEARTAADNVRARRLLEHLGFELEGLQPRAHDGTRDRALYGLLRRRRARLPAWVETQSGMRRIRDAGTARVSRMPRTSTASTRTTPTTATPGTAAPAPSR